MAARDVFVSYSHNDHDVAFELVASLEAHSITCWIAPRDIAPSADWAEEIIDAISAARLMVLVFSAGSNDSPQVRREVERAVHKQVKILPFRIENVMPSKSLEYFLSSQHWMDAFSRPLDVHYSRLRDYIEMQLAARAMSARPAGGGAVRAVIPAVPSSTLPGMPGVPGVQSGQAAAGALAELDMKAIELHLAAFIGPMARFLVRTTASRASSVEDFIAKLAVEVDAPADRRAFEQRCRQSVQKLR
jgi:TIR domain